MHTVVALRVDDKNCQDTLTDTLGGMQMQTSKGASKEKTSEKSTTEIHHTNAPYECILRMHH